MIPHWASDGLVQRRRKVTVAVAVAAVPGYRVNVHHDTSVSPLHKLFPLTHVPSNSIQASSICQPCLEIHFSTPDIILAGGIRAAQVSGPFVFGLGSHPIRSTFRHLQPDKPKQPLIHYQVKHKRDVHHSTISRLPVPITQGNFDVGPMVCYTTPKHCLVVIHFEP
jgi:hypothetical protein